MLHGPTRANNSRYAQKTILSSSDQLSQFEKNRRQLSQFEKNRRIQPMTMATGFTSQIPRRGAASGQLDDAASLVDLTMDGALTELMEPS